MSVIIWFFVIYLLIRFIFKFVIPLISATRTVRTKVNEMRQNMEGQPTTFSSREQNTFNGPSNTNHAGPSSAKGDYIDFEEIKE